MLTFNSNLKPLPFTTYEQLIEIIDPYQIYSFYIPGLVLNKFIKCPIKIKRGYIETNPSFMVHMWNDKLQWISYPDYSKSSDVVAFVKEYFELNYFYDALYKIYDDIIEPGLHNNIPKLSGNIKNYFSVSPKIYLRSWKIIDKKYWEQYKFNIKHLNKWKVFPVQEYWSGSDDQKILKYSYEKNKKDPMYLYEHDSHKGIYTLYRPLAKDSKDKFRKYNVNNHIMGKEYLPFIDEEVVFITSSYKDIMTFDLLNYYAVAPHTEKADISQELINYLKITFKYIYIAYDNDTTGVKNSIKLTNTYNVFYWNVPKKYINSKDPSDLVKNHGLSVLEESINEKFKRDGIK